MIDFTTALKAKLPFIGIHTDDPVNVKAVLKELSGKDVMAFPATANAPVGDTYLYWTEKTDKADHITTENYRKLSAASASAVVINPQTTNPLVNDIGILPTPDRFYEDYLKTFVSPGMIPKIVRVLQGLSVKAAQETIMVTMARTNAVTPNEIRKTRQMLTAEHPGLSPLDTTYDFYEWPKELKEWYELNQGYFLNLDVPEKLVPRGILLAGEPGVGKSMAATVLAHEWDVPLFRLNVARSLNKYIGTSEERIDVALSLIEQNAPCVWLLDEVEKLFGAQDNEGTVSRILSQLLWWLQYHRSRVLTVMTTNDLEKIPKELYRAERVDTTLHLPKLTLSQARTFSERVYAAVMGQLIDKKRQKALYELLEHADKGSFSHAEARVLVYGAIKSNGWLEKLQSVAGGLSK